MAGGGLPRLGPAIGHILNVRNGSKADVRRLVAGMGGKRTLEGAWQGDLLTAVNGGSDADDL